MNLNIRKIASKDKDIFLAMSREFYSSEAVLHDIDNEYHNRAFKELMRSDMYLDCYMFEADSKIIGYALLNKTYCREAGGPAVWIEELYIVPEYQGRGCGSYFFKWMEKHIPTQRYRLEVEPDNKRAMMLYDKMGYQKLPYVQMMKE
ncbi:GNAT family N-acetyltransferase [Paratissierella segnis]|jgi:GNAT superfamily N-acetyltransferase|uniref:GNAT family N-acetyltransferase n=1 Tax=Paratissierella segnis TaxID=2763679 RepID=A0A926EV41_9FIRM|nr:GNAT family N-acetyltransferase [Paratissierella segnis]MBC8589070.1 GNAT family N-acetyltransferase [Paratissierella segnis]